MPTEEIARSAATPYADLTPDLILDSVESAGLLCDGHLLALNSYENRVYQVGIEDSLPLVAKFYRPARWSDAQIAEEHAFAFELVELEIPVVAPLLIEGESLRHAKHHRFALYPRRGGRAPELEQSDILKWLGRFLARIHNVGGLRNFALRPALDIETHGIEPRAWLLEHDFIPPDLHEAWVAVVDQALDGVRACFDRAGAFANIRIHGDCHTGNILWREANPRTGESGGPHFVDLDDSRNGPAMQDLWMLLSGDRAAMTRQLSEVLAGYEEFRDLDRRELHLIEALRTLRLIHYAAWLARRWDDPAFPLAFPWFNTQRYWQDRILELREQIAAMQEPPLGPL